MRRHSTARSKMIEDWWDAAVAVHCIYLVFRNPSQSVRSIRSRVVLVATGPQRVAGITEPSPGAGLLGRASEADSDGAEPGVEALPESRAEGRAFGAGAGTAADAAVVATIGAETGTVRYF